MKLININLFLFSPIAASVLLGGDSEAQIVRTDIFYSASKAQLVLLVMIASVNTFNITLYELAQGENTLEAKSPSVLVGNVKRKSIVRFSLFICFVQPFHMFCFIFFLILVSKSSEKM
jgi:hypothetical protein